MSRRVRTAFVAAFLSSALAATVLAVAMSGPSTAEARSDLDPAAVSTAVHEALFTLFPAATPGTPPPASADGVGAFDPDTATWHLRTRGGDPTVFRFGTPGSLPLVGDWDGDGTDTIGTYDSATGAVALRNTNTAGDPDISHTIGSPGDVPIAGDFDGDGIDTVSVFRPSDGFVYVHNTVGDGDPEAVYAPAGSPDQLVAADFDGDGVDTIAARESSSGVVTINTAAGAIDKELSVPSSGARFFSGDWTGDGIDTAGSFNPATATVRLRYENADGGPDESYTWGELGNPRIQSPSCHTLSR